MYVNRKTFDYSTRTVCKCGQSSLRFDKYLKGRWCADVVVL